MWTSLVRQFLPAKWRIAGYVVLGLAGWWAIHRMTEPREDPRIVVATENALKAGKAYRAQRAQDAKTIGRLSRKAEAQMKVADSLRRASDSIPLPTTPPDTCAPWVAKLDLKTHEADTLRAAVATQDSIIVVDSLRRQRAEQRADTLETLLEKNRKRGLLSRLDVNVYVEFQQGEKPAAGVSVRLPF